MVWNLQGFRIRLTPRQGTEDVSVSLRVSVNQSIFIGERRWTLVEVVSASRHVRMRGPNGRIRDVCSTSPVEIEPEVHVKLGRGHRAQSLEFECPRTLPIHLEETQAWLEARYGDV